MIRTALTVLVILTLFSINLNAQQVSFSGDAVHPESFFTSVSKQTGYVFFYNASQLRNIPPLSIQLKNVSLDSAMHFVLKNQPFTYSIQGKTIFLSPVKFAITEFSTEKTSGLQKIRGRVVDRSGLPVPGASIVSTNPKTSTLTRENGDFQVMLRKGDSLIISSIGYSKTIIKPDSNFIIVAMSYSASPLDQVVVGGNLFATKKEIGYQFTDYY